MRDLRRWALTAGVLLTFWLIMNVRFAFRLADWYQRVARGNPPLGVSIWKAAQVILCILAVMALHRMRPRQAVAELGLAHPALRSLGLAALLTLPAILVLAITTRALAETDAQILIRTGVASPISEEILFRGFLFLQLYRRASLPFWLAAVISAVPFATGHLFQAGGRGIAGFAEVMLFMSIMSAFAAWVFTRWDDNTWLLIGIHAFANLAWALFVGDETTKMYGWLQYAFAGLLLAPVVLATIYRRRLPWLPLATATPLPAESGPIASRMSSG